MNNIITEPLTLVEGTLADWHTIERADHDGRHVLAAGGLTYSGRITNACIEGTAEQMMGIARAIKDRGAFTAKRCSVIVRDDGMFSMCSPRNSEYAAIVAPDIADALADEIIAKLGAE